MGRRRWLRSQKWQVVLSFFLQISITSRFLATAQTDGERFLQQKEQQVKAIADKAVLNAGDTSCDLISSCTASNCSRAACLRLRSDIDSYECVDVPNNVTTCGCNRFQANFKRSYVRVPLLSSDKLNSINTESMLAICSQRGLDTMFQSFPRDGTFYNRYLGTVDGSFRVYPGTEVNRCEDYDPRSRPWYVGAISVIKDLVVLVDVSFSMGEEFGFFGKTTPLSSALNMTQLLLGTLTKGDRATVISYNASSSILVEPFHVDEGTVNISDSNFKALLNSVGDTTPDKVKGPSNITAGISAALSVLDSSSPDALKVILVFTDGESSALQSDLDSLIVQLNQANVTLFMYQINGMDASLKNLACSVTLGHNEQLSITPLRNPSQNPFQNPLYALKSYFSYLARNRGLAAPQQLSFWQPPYPDYGILGNVITVAYPVISPSGDLVGVAGIDVQVDGLSQGLKEEIYKALENRTTQPPSSSLRANFAACDAGSNDGATLCHSEASSAVAVCPRTDKEHSLKQLLCCRGCGGLEGSKKNLTDLWIVLGSLVSLGFLAVLAILPILLVKKKPWAPRISPPPVQQRESHNPKHQTPSGSSRDPDVTRNALGA